MNGVGLSKPKSVDNNHNWLILLNFISEMRKIEMSPAQCRSKEGMFCLIKSARGCIESQAIGSCLEHVPKHTHRGFQTFQEGIFCLGERGRTVLTFVNDTATMILCGIGRMILNIRRVTCRALAS